MRTMTAAKYILIALLVIILGAFSGWYLFLRSQTAATQASDTARGFSAGYGSPFGQTSGPQGGPTAQGAPNARPPQLWQ